MAATLEAQACACGCGREVKPGRTHVKGHATRGRCRDGGPDYEVTEAGCWHWRGTKIAAGYGTRTVDGKTLLAHRIYYERENGLIPDGLTLDHLCRNPSCVNPDHLEAVTHTENCRRGANTKLTVALAAEIREAPGSQREIARRYGVSKTTVAAIRQGKTWR